MKHTEDIEARESGSEGQLAGEPEVLEEAAMIRVCAWCDQGRTKGKNVTHGICEYHRKAMLEGLKHLGGAK